MRTLRLTIFVLLGGAVLTDKVGQKLYTVESVVGADCSVPCITQGKAGVQYMYLAWYKMQMFPDSPEPQRRGLLISYPDGRLVHWANLKREVALRNETRELLLPNVTCGDQGEYVCKLQAPVGEVILMESVRLLLSDCPGFPIRSPSKNPEMIVAVSVALTILLVVSMGFYCGISTFRQEKKTGSSRWINSAKTLETPRRWGKKHRWILMI
ncbi:uncharacterized protein LOC130914347 [Corythoichthys intestinalis]|uniref:uncharacterized protein LOC130914347 n=1 Tax=Corythoichthys intestinalis TaxID=161448 RepID=UPI0025A5EE11|nr:uncharacterized protein LOC130914347 [Corythoichthys intestinalis]